MEEQQPVRRELMWGWTGCFSLFQPPLCLSLTRFSSPPSPLGLQPPALEMKPHAGAAARIEEEEDGGEEAAGEEDDNGLAPAAARTPASNQTGCGEAVKLHKETAGKPQEVKRKKAAQNVSLLCSITKYSLKNLWSFKNVSAGARLLEAVACAYRGKKNYHFTSKSSLGIVFFVILDSGSQLMTSDWRDGRINMSLNALELTTAPANMNVWLQK